MVAVVNDAENPPGRLLKRIRGGLDLTQAEVAERMGVSQSRVSEIENCSLTAMEVDTLRRYVEALGCTLTLVVEFDDEHGQTTHQLRVT